VLRAKRRSEKETNDAASGSAGKALARERKERCSEPRGGQNVDERKKPTMQ
jgi:hypothetical protein